jgi:hypothetical protein
MIVMAKKQALRIRDVYSGSQILIFIHPGSQIPDPTTAPKEEGEKLFSGLPFL